MQPKYNLEKIKFGTDAPTFEKAVALYESGKVTQFKEELNGFFAVVVGTHPYKVYVDNKHYDQGDCDCYLGQNETLCKHMVAVAIYAVMGGKELSSKDKQTIDGPVCNGKLGELSKLELSDIKKEISGAMKYIKSYVGPSKTWFAYQNSLSEGCARLSKIVSELPVRNKHLNYWLICFYGLMKSFVTAALMIQTAQLTDLSRKLLLFSKNLLNFARIAKTLLWLYKIGKLVLVGKSHL